MSVKAWMRCIHEADLIDPFLFPIVQARNTTFFGDSGRRKGGLSCAGAFFVSSQDQCVKGQELMILVWVWVGNALLHSAKDFEASVGIAFSQTSFSDSCPILIHTISSLTVQFNNHSPTRHSTTSFTSG